MATARRKRRSFHEPGHAHELTFSCYHKFPFLKSDRTCYWLADSINAARADRSFLLYAYVFMPDHVHLLIQPTAPAPDQVAAILRAIKQPVARRAVEHLRRHAPHWLDRIAQPRGTRTEHRFWQPGGGYDRNLTNPKTLRASIDSIHLNPVRRGLVERIVDWPWSSAAWFHGLGTSQPALIPDGLPPEWVESPF